MNNETAKNLGYLFVIMLIILVVMWILYMFLPERDYYIPDDYSPYSSATIPSRG